MYPASNVQVAKQPSPEILFRSSHSSLSVVSPSPQTGEQALGDTEIEHE